VHDGEVGAVKWCTGVTDLRVRGDWPDRENRWCHGELGCDEHREAQMPKVIMLVCEGVRGVAIFVAALGLVGLVVSGENRVSSVLIIGGAALAWIFAYAALRTSHPRPGEPRRSMHRRH